MWEEDQTMPEEDPTMPEEDPTMPEEYQIKCLGGKVKKEPQSPPPELIVEEEEESESESDSDNEPPPPPPPLPPPPPPPPPIQKTYGHSALSKYHTKCIEDEFRKKKRPPQPLPLPPLPSPPPSPPPESIEKRSSLLDVLSASRNCTCEVVARAVRSHIHMNIGLEGKRDFINGIRRISTVKISSSTKLDKPTK